MISQFPFLAAISKGCFSFGGTDVRHQGCSLLLLFVIKQVARGAFSLAETISRSAVSSKHSSSLTTDFPTMGLRSMEEGAMGEGARRIWFTTYTGKISPLINFRKDRRVHSHLFIFPNTVRKVTHNSRLRYWFVKQT